MNLLPAQPATAITAEAPSDKPSDNLPASLRTLPTILRAGDGGSLAQIMVGETPISDRPKALEKELDKYFQDPDLPFDQTLLKVDPRLKYSELMKVMNAFSNAFVHAKKAAQDHLRRADARRRRMIDRGTALRFFQGSELPRLLVLAVIMVVGWGLVWQFRQKMPERRRAPSSRRRANPSRSSPIVPSSSRPSPIERRWSSATTRPMRCSWNGARGRLAGRAGRSRPPRHRAGPSLAEPRALPRSADPSAGHGAASAALSVEAEPDRLALRGLDHHARDARELPYVCVFEDAPEGFPIGPNVSERVVFNGYFLKI